MMKAIMPMVSALIFIACFIKTAYSIQCYLCESSDKSSCGPDFKAEDAFKVNCSVITPPRYTLHLNGNNLSATGCSKSVTEVMGNKVVKRGCNFGDPKDKLGCTIDPTGHIEKLISCDICSEDFCNGSGAIRAATVTGITLITSLLINLAF